MLKILAVDDQQVNLDILREMLEDYSVRTACDGDEAIRVAREFVPDIVLLDVMMPLLGGIETCRHLRRIPALNDCRIIMVSAKAMAMERAEGLAAGADDYITKPFDDTTLFAALGSCCDVVRE
jgi:CheY-like chemotaxis protein